jgi:hypothetical protein
MKYRFYFFDIGTTKKVIPTQKKNKINISQIKFSIIICLYGNQFGILIISAA